MGYPSSKVSTKVKNYADQVALIRGRMRYSHPLTAEIDKLFEELNVLNLRGAERFQHPNIAKARELEIEMINDINSREILIEF